MSIVIWILTFFLVLASAFLILIVLAQKAKSDGGMGSAMGGGMASSLLGADFPLTIYDTNPAATAPLAARGAVIASGPRAVADAASIVFACLPSQDVSRAVAKEVVQGSTVDLYIETSTIGSTCMDDIAATLRGSRITLLDGPISGGSKAAHDGILSTIVSGERPAFDRVRPAIDAFAKHVFYLGGEPGQAQIAKLINNLLSLAGRAIAFEGVAMGIKVGIDPKILAEFINVSTGRNMATLDAFPARLLHMFHSGPKKSIGIKDLELYVEEAERLDAPLFTTPLVLDLFLEGATYGTPGNERRPLSDYVDRLREVAGAGTPSGA
jgi:3-hydroxyisobutyrate dehydrogenase-like beta-hydroxyacid dehydrogenase